MSCPCVATCADAQVPLGDRVAALEKGKFRQGQRFSDNSGVGDPKLQGVRCTSGLVSSDGRPGVSVRVATVQLMVCANGVCGGGGCSCHL